MLAHPLASARRFSCRCCPVLGVLSADGRASPSRSAQRSRMVPRRDVHPPPTISLRPVDPTGERARVVVLHGGRADTATCLGGRCSPWRAISPGELRARSRSRNYVAGGRPKLDHVRRARIRRPRRDRLPAERAPGCRSARSLLDGRSHGAGSRPRATGGSALVADSASRHTRRVCRVTMPDGLPTSSPHRSVEVPSTCTSPPWRAAQPSALRVRPFRRSADQNDAINRPVEHARRLAASIPGPGKL